MAESKKSKSKGKQSNSLVVNKNNTSTKKKTNSSKSKSLTTTKKHNEDQIIKIVTKYKDMPLNELYSDLEGMKQYRGILLERRDELIKARSIIDSDKRRVAIQKTMENTYDIEFKLQDATFKNHYVPTGFKVVESTPIEEPKHDRVMVRTVEREIKETPLPPPPAPKPQQVIHNHYTTIINNEQPKPVQQGFIPQTITLYPQQPQTTEIEISKPTFSIVWPLYERIKEIIRPRKYSSLIFPFIIIASILVAAALAFAIIWGFSIGWKDWDANVIQSISDFFKNGFK